MAEPKIIIQDREELAELLTEAAEVEHNLMCCYLFAAWSLKNGVDDGLTEAEAEAVNRWRKTLIHVAIDEMAHFTLANNLLVAIGGRPHLSRPNFPVSPGYHPAGVVVELRPFSSGTIDHFVYLERPEGEELADGAGFGAPRPYQRDFEGTVLMPTAQDYSTVGHLYRGIRDGLEFLSAAMGEDALFSGDPSCQIGPGLVQMDGLIGVTDLASALRAIDNIVDQGEGNADNPENSHYRRFCDVRDEFAALCAKDSTFNSVRAVVESPVQRRPPIPGGKTWIGEARAARVLDLCNALYNHMLRMLGVAWSPVLPEVRGAIVGEAIGLMRVLVPLNRVLTGLPASDDDSVARAGMSFAVSREIRIPEVGSASILVERTRLLAAGALTLGDLDPALREVAGELEAMAVRLEALPLDGRPSVVAAPKAAKPSAPAAPTTVGDLEYSADPTIPPRRIIDGVEVVEAKGLTLLFDTPRCIHARRCVLGAPDVFVGNVVGPWLRPDAMDPESLVAIAHQCPSGAVGYRRKDGRPDEAAPPVNTLRVRESGPYAVHADLRIEGEAPRFRATLCRCGASKKKPFCDGSHHDIHFEATGEPPTGDVAALAVRDGPLSVRPTKNGPLMVSGNLELCSGTGRTVAKETQCVLCRCGGSKTKPFCDGTHRTNGFTSES